MPLSMYQASIPVLSSGLSAGAKFLGKAAAEAQSRGMDETALLDQRLAPDMFPLVRQVQIVSDAAKGVAARLAGQPVPSYPDTEASFAELQARLDRTRAFVEEFGPAEIDGSEEREVVLTIGGNPMHFTGQSYLFGFAMPNFYFHLTTAYAILRHQGFALGKRDFLGRA